MLCQLCNIIHDGLYGSGRFCSSKCAKSFSTSKNRLLINQKISESMTSQHSIKNCKTCSNIFSTLERGNRTEYCSAACGKIRNNITKQLLSDNAKKFHKEGKIKGWSSRLNKSPSYPEKYFISLFENEKITFKRELKVGKWFIDFVVKNFAIEIDGKQHEYAERKKSDIEKDEYLISQGYEIIRIKWYNPINESNKEKLYNQIISMKKLII